ncbi:MAG: hypothetical protein RBR15_15380 [Sphaerochaeta sp.]|nr:hypothetical protein [Sphaerochaeta sp.]
MNIFCVVKFVPDVDTFSYDYERHTIDRDGSVMRLNADDASAIGFALQAKKDDPHTTIEVVTMAPPSVVPLLEELLRVGVDRATLISDPLFAGSDTFATSTILSRYLSGFTYDCILTGTHALDGDTSHVPSQIAQALDLDHLNTILVIDRERFSTSFAAVEVEGEAAVTTYEIGMPAVLGLTREAAYKLPYVRYKDLHLDVSSRIGHISNRELGFSPDEVGLQGSRTKVVSTYTKVYQTRARKMVAPDEGGLEFVYGFLKTNGFV